MVRCSSCVARDGVCVDTSARSLTLPPRPTTLQQKTQMLTSSGDATAIKATARLHARPSLITENVTSCLISSHFVIACASLDVCADSFTQGVADFDDVKKENVDLRATVQDLQKTLEEIEFTLAITRKAGRRLLEVGQTLEKDKHVLEVTMAAKHSELAAVRSEIGEARKDVSDTKATLGSVRKELEMARHEIKQYKKREYEFQYIHEKFTASFLGFEAHCSRMETDLSRLQNDCKLLQQEKDQLTHQLEAAQRSIIQAQQALALQAQQQAQYQQSASASATTTANGSTTSKTGHNANQLDPAQYNNDTTQPPPPPKGYNDLARDFLRCLEIKDYGGFASNVVHLVTYEQAKQVNDWNALAIGALWLIAMAGDCHHLPHVTTVLDCLPDVRDNHDWVLAIEKLHEFMVTNQPKEFFQTLDLLQQTNMVKQVSPLKDILNALRILQRIRFLNAFMSQERFRRADQISVRMALYKTDFRDGNQLKQWLERELDGTNCSLFLTSAGKNISDIRTLKARLNDKLKGAENTYKKALDYLTTQIPPVAPGTTQSPKKHSTSTTTSTDSASIGVTGTTTADNAGSQYDATATGHSTNDEEHQRCNGHDHAHETDILDEDYDDDEEDDEEDDEVEDDEDDEDDEELEAEGEFDDDV